MSDREVIRRHSKSFALAARILPREVRGRAEALYAWCRAADDRIDHAADQSAAQDALCQLRAEVDDVFDGRPVSTPAADALRRAVAAGGIPREYPLELLAGFAMDVSGVQYATANDLLIYCHRVAGVVGLMMCHALEVRDDAALDYAAHLGIAMQLTNIARDVAEDWSRGRLYLPAEWLPRLPSGDEPLPDAMLAPAVRRCLELANQYYESGEAGLRYLSPRCRVAVHTASRVYQAIGGQVAAVDYSPARGRAFVPARRKFAALLSCAIRAIPKLFTPMGRVHRPMSRATFRPLRTFPNSTRPNFEVQIMNSTTRSWRDAMSTVTFALALTAIMATTLFITVGINPKAEMYGSLPWIYAGGCLVLSAISYRISLRMDRLQG